MSRWDGTAWDLVVDDMPEKLTLFWHGPFSQWWYQPFVVDGESYECAEQWMMACKARLFNDAATEAKIMEHNRRSLTLVLMREPTFEELCTMLPRAIKRLGRTVKGFNRPTWERECRRLVQIGNEAKFQQHEDLRSKLFSTAGTTLVEASPYDQVWGIGLAADDPRAKSRETWLGTNYLGEVLTAVREKLMGEH